MYAIDGNMDPINIHQYTPFMLAYIPAPWILWVIHIQIDEPFPNPSKKHDQPIGPVAAKLCPSPCRWGHCRISEPLGVVCGKVGLLQLEITYKWSWVVVWNIWIIVHFIYGIYNPSHWLTDIFQDGEIAPPTRYKWRFFDRNILDFPLPCQTGALVLGLFTTNSIQQPLILSNSWRHKTLASGWIHVFLVKEWQCPFLPFFSVSFEPSFWGASQKWIKLIDVYRVKPWTRPSVLSWHVWSWQAVLIRQAQHFQSVTWIHHSFPRRRLCQLGWRKRTGYR